MTYERFEKLKKEYLGFCSLKGHIYSVEVGEGIYRVVAVDENNEVWTLIEFQAKQK